MIHSEEFIELDDVFLKPESPKFQFDGQNHGKTGEDFPDETNEESHGPPEASHRGLQQFLRTQFVGTSCDRGRPLACVIYGYSYLMDIDINHEYINRWILIIDILINGCYGHWIIIVNINNLIEY